MKDKFRLLSSHVSIEWHAVA